MVAGSLPEGIEELGAAIEMLHTYSLIHDDLPALDNDDLRRGSHVPHSFRRALAILAGDALQTHAYEVLARFELSCGGAVRIIRRDRPSHGHSRGMIGGQVLDLEGEHTKPTPRCSIIHRAKTGALIRVSLVTGGLYAGAHNDRVS